MMKTHASALTPGPSKSQVRLRGLIRTTGTMNRRAVVRLRLPSSRPELLAAAQAVIYDMPGEARFCFQTLASK